MVMVMKLKHVDELSGGRKRFRRRYPKAVSQALSWPKIFTAAGLTLCS